jgi:hypothetical protein
MKFPLFPINFDSHIKEFIFVSLIYSFSIIITIRMNNYLDLRKNKCLKNENNNSLYCKLLRIKHIDNISLFTITFVSTFLAYLLKYYLFGYKG